MGKKGKKIKALEKKRDSERGRESKISGAVKKTEKKGLHKK